eukprot:9493753-Pyramimonas_sp.AAC.1
MDAAARKHLEELCEKRTPMPAYIHSRACNSKQTEAIGSTAVPHLGGHLEPPLRDLVHGCVAQPPAFAWFLARP